MSPRDDLDSPFGSAPQDPDRTIGDDDPDRTIGDDKDKTVQWADADSATIQFDDNREVARPSAGPRRPKRAGRVTARTKLGGSDDPLIGKELGGCEILEFLGQGGMATVYLARQLGLDREVAVKVLSPELTRDNRQVEQFTREAKTLARLEHPNVVTVYAVGAEENVNFLVIQLIRGGALDDVLKERGKLPPAEATDVVKQIAQGLGEAHRQGIVHRDIKPANVLVAPGNVMKVTDFGLAIMSEGAGSALSEGRVVGTPHYMSPEQVDARAVDLRTDIYALGATFYHLLTGSPPFKARSAVELLIKHVKEPVEPPHVREPAVPEALSSVVCRMMEKDPAARFASMDEVLEALAHPDTAPKPEVAPPVSVGAKLSATFLSDDVALPPMSAELKPIEVEAPKFVRQGAIGLVALIALLLGAGIGPLKTVLVGVASAEASESPEEQVARVDFAALEPELKSLGEPEALDRLTAFVQAHPGTKTADAAAERIGPLEEKIFGEQRRQVEEIVAKAEKAEKAGQLGPALDELDAVTPELAKVPGAPDVAGLRAKLRAGLQARGVAWVPAGEYRTGEGEHMRSVFVAGFYLGLREVTCGEFAEFLAEKGGDPPLGWATPAPPGDPNLPVGGVDARRAIAYAAWRGGRLPKSTEWEKAARGLEGSRWPWGAKAEPGDCNWGASPQAKPMVAGSFPKDVSPFGCLDMAGNVAELTLGPGSTDADPVVWARGGGFRTDVLLNARPGFYLDDVAADVRHPALGFRLAYSELPRQGGGK